MEILKTKIWKIEIVKNKKINFVKKQFCLKDSKKILVNNQL